MYYYKLLRKPFEGSEREKEKERNIHTYKHTYIGIHIMYVDSKKEDKKRYYVLDSKSLIVYKNHSKFDKL